MPRGLWVDLRQFGVEDLAAFGCGAGVQAGAQGLVGRHLWDGPAFHQCPHVEPRAAHHYGQPAAAVDIGDSGPGQVAVLGQGQHLVGRHHVDEVVAQGGLLRGAGFGGADIHAAIDLARIGRDGLAAQGLPQGHGQGGLAHGGGTHDHQDACRAHRPPTAGSTSRRRTAPRPSNSMATRSRRQVTPASSWSAR